MFSKCFSLSVTFCTVAHFTPSNAASVLKNIGKDAVPALIIALKDEDTDVRSSAANALGNIGKDAKSAVPTLITLLKDKDDNVRSKAVNALGNIGIDAVSALIIALKDENILVW
ncbi:HEAT repeat domain-containing protein [Nostoc sp. FACHB-145]|uniref:HEAT repeat domain-containing protein n=1 Tax=Nostoc sp. FACHB-145 TaxID=2692836 RepID=UPI00168532A8|nr:HEAT repeat domain-containing protein [Nostoc sp. FACHB-145]MBD2472408.1 HEAT repeat domain-containing protein [Nostoc sp. FACHB-145]